MIISEEVVVAPTHKRLVYTQTLIATTIMPYKNMKNIKRVAKTTLFIIRYS